MDGKQEFLYSFPKNEKEEIRFSVREFKGQVYFEARLFFKSDKGDWLPTKKGLTLSLGHYSEFRKGVSKIGEQVSVLGRAA